MNAKRWNHQNYRKQQSHPEVYAIGLPSFVQVSEGVGMCWNIALLKNRVRTNIQLFQCKSETHLMSLYISGTYCIDYFCKIENVLLVDFQFNSFSDLILVKCLCLSFSCTPMSA
jgi:hypothetical protein